jgi:hypothetical protein
MRHMLQPFAIKEAAMPKRTLLSLFAISLLTATSWAAENSFVGKWKLNPEKSQLTDEMKVASLGGNKYAFDFGGGNPETIVVDGTDQPGMFGTTLAVTAEAPDTWKVVRKKDGRTIVTGLWKLSPDGTTLTDTFRANRPDGSISSLDYVYTRRAGTTGFPGTWESTTEKVNSTYQFQIQPYETDGLSFINPAQQSTSNIKFDGNDYPNQGPNLPQNYVTSGRRMNQSTLELTDKIDGKVRDVQEIKISPDGKTLIITVQPVGRSKPNIMVFDRE